MGWKLMPDGQLHLVYFSSVRAIIEKDDVLPDEGIWSMDDYYNFEGDVEKEMQRRFKEKKISWELFDIDPHDLASMPIDVYFIDWPQNVAKLLLDNYMAYIRRNEKSFKYHAYPHLLEIALPIANAVDQIRDDKERTYTILVQRELDSANKLYGVL